VKRDAVPFAEIAQIAVAAAVAQRRIVAEGEERRSSRELLADGRWRIGSTFTGAVA